MRLVILLIAIGFFCPNVSSILDIYSNSNSYQKVDSVVQVLTRNESLIPETKLNSTSNNFLSIIAEHLKANKIDLNSLASFSNATVLYDTEFLKNVNYWEVNTLNISDARTDSFGEVTRKNLTIEARVMCSSNARWCYLATLEAVRNEGNGIPNEVGRSKYRCTTDDRVYISETFEHFEPNEPHTIEFNLYHSCLKKAEKNGIRKFYTQATETFWPGKFYFDKDIIDLGAPPLIETDFFDFSEFSEE